MVKALKFTIIVPVYNMEQYLVRCLDSILNQDYLNYEVICVNDGSSDNSLKILESYAERDERIVIINKNNGGLGMARNTGLDYATGDYVWFVDSDDWIEKGSLTRLNRCINQTNSLNTYIIDMIQTDENTYKRKIKSCPRKQGVLSSNRFAKDLLLCNALFFAQNKIYKYDFIKDYRFNTGFYEDVPQIILFGKEVFDVYIMHEALYYYYAREGSIMKTVDNRVLDIFKQIDIVYDGLYQNNDYQRYCTHLFYYITDRTYRTIIQSKKENLLIDFKRELKDRRKKFLCPLYLFFFNEISLRRKMRFFLILKNYLFI